MSTLPPFDTSAPPPAVPQRKNRTVLIVLAIVGCGGLCMALILGSAILLPVFLQAREAAKVSACRKSMEQVGLAVEKYVEDHKGKFPPSRTWSKEIEPYLDQSSSVKPYCPNFRSDMGTGAGYAFNEELGGKDSAKIKDLDQTYVLIEVDNKVRNATFNIDTVETTTRHMNGHRYNGYIFRRGAHSFTVEGPYIPVE